MDSLASSQEPHAAADNRDDEEPRLHEPLMGPAGTLTSAASTAWTPSSQYAIPRKPLPRSMTTSVDTQSSARPTPATSSNSATYSRLATDEANTPERPVGDSRPHAAKQTGTFYKWLPYSLRWWFLSVLLAYTVALFAAVIILHILSERHSGLGDDRGSSSLTFATRFTPTLLAVIHGLLVMLLVEDVKRTEAYARLSGPRGAPAAATILNDPGPWWSTLANSFPRRKIGRTMSWAMLCSVLAYVFGFLLLSPFSAALLASQDVYFSDNVSFQRRAPPATLLRVPEAGMTYFRSIGHILQNVTTSAWIGDQYAAVPFGPSAQSSIPLDPVLTTDDQSWSANTTVLTTSMSCDPLEFVEKGWNNHSTTWSAAYGVSPYVSLAAQSGCAYSLMPDNLSTVVTMGGASWSGSSNESVGDSFVNDNRPKLVNSTGCSNGEVIIVSTPWLIQSLVGDDIEFHHRWDPDFRIAGYICSTDFFTAEIAVTADTVADDTNLKFDDQEYKQQRQPLFNEWLDIDAFQDVFLNSNWSQYMANVANVGLLGVSPAAGGPAHLLAALYNSSMEAMLDDQDLLAKATKIKQRFMGETLRSAFPGLRTEQIDSSSSTITTIRRRIVAVPAAAIVLESVLAAQLLFLCATVFSTRTSRRPLGIASDPGPPLSTASLVGDRDVQVALRDKYGLSKQEMEQSIGRDCFKVDEGTLLLEGSSIKEYQGHARPTPVSQSPQYPGPTVSRIWALLSFLFALFAVLIVIAVLYWFAHHAGLYQSAFVYQSTISIGNHQLGIISPAAIVTTFLAVSIGLWWGALESTFRKLQPFLALMNERSDQQKSATLSYQSTYFLWASAKAARHRHWLLALFCVGATLCQIFTIAMSALWQREPGYLVTGSSVPPSLQLRQIPHVFLGEISPSVHGGDLVAAQALGRLYTNLMTNWMYSAAIQLSLNGSEPTWSHDGWSFVPVDLDSIPHDSNAETGATAGSAEAAETNVTLKTPAIRGRLECSPIPSLDNQTLWLTKHNVGNTSAWNASSIPNGITEGYELGCDGQVDYEDAFRQLVLFPNTTLPGPCKNTKYTTFFANQRHIACCVNNATADVVGPASVGYWSPNFDDDYRFPQISTEWPFNLTVKWIHGTPFDSAYQYTNYNASQSYPYPNLLWTQVPEIAALNCMPVMETANASVSLSHPSGRVHAYKILDTPQPDAYGWLDVLVDRNFSSANVDNQGLQPQNMTMSHNVLFMLALLGAADLTKLAGPDIVEHELGPETLTDRTFNFRETGLNVDYMSYSMLSQVGGDQRALLDPQTLRRIANTVFSTYFQHFVSSNVTLADGGWAYSKIGEALPRDLPPPVSYNYNGIGESHAPNASVYYGPDAVQLTAHRRVEMLHMSVAAAWICLAILVCLIAVLILAATMRRQLTGGLRREISCMADVAVLVAGSRALLGLIQARGLEVVWRDETLRTRLGWFRGEDGRPRWGIELVDGEGADGYGVEWLNEEDVRDLDLNEKPAGQNVTVGASVPSSGVSVTPTSQTGGREDGRGASQAAGGSPPSVDTGLTPVSPISMPVSAEEGARHQEGLTQRRHL